MRNREQEMNAFLKKIADKEEIFDDYQGIYGELAVYGFNKDERNQMIEENYIAQQRILEKNDLRTKMSAIAKNKGNFYNFLYFDSNSVHKFFLLFKYGYIDKEMTYKIYIPFTSFESDEKQIAAVLEYTNFLDNNKIENDSKLSKPNRADSLVSRIRKKEDVKKIIEFINTSEYKDIIYDTNPFLINEGKVGLAFDGTLSYNTLIAKYIYCYLQECKKENKLDTMNANDFRKFILKYYNENFITLKSHLELEENDNPVLKKGYTQDNFIDTLKVSELILVELSKNANIDSYFGFFDFANSNQRQGYYEKLYNKFESKKKSLQKSKVRKK